MLVWRKPTKDRRAKV